MASSTQEYAVGSILHVKVKDFMTYDEVIVYPGPNLNVVIGPNGSGKSTIVCALCLGLCGSPKDLGRSNLLGDYVKQGKSVATVEIALHDPVKQVVICRKLRREGGSEWFLNSHKTSEGEVKKEVEKYHIDIGNMCQFLAQDRVGDFLKQTPQMLLENTEKSIARDLHTKHRNLMSQKNDRAGLQENLDSLIEKRDRFKNRVNELEPDMANMKKRQKVTSAIEMLTKKLAWIQYEEARVVADEKTKEVAAVVEEFKKVEEQGEPLERQVHEAKTKIKSSEDALKKQKGSLDVCRRELDRFRNSIEALDDRNKDLVRELESKKNEEYVRKTKILVIKKEIENLQMALNQCTDDDNNFNDTLQQINVELRKTDGHIQETEELGDEVKREIRRHQTEQQYLEAQVRKLRDESTNRLKHVEDIDRDTYQAYVWYQQNKASFARPIHGPILLSIAMKDMNKAKYLENVISRRDLLAFVCEDAEDSDRFVEASLQHKWHINCAAVPKEPMTAFATMYLDEQLRSYGFYACISDLFEAPQAVMRYLCKLHRLHTVPVGNQHTDDQLEAVIQNCQNRLRLFFTNDRRCAIKISKYSKQASVTHNGVRPSSMLKASGESGDHSDFVNNLQELNNKIETFNAKLKEYGDRKRHLEIQRERLRQEKKALQTRQGRKIQIQSQIATKQNSLARLESQASDIEEFERSMREQISANLKLRLTDTINMANALDEVQLLSYELAKATFAVIDATRSFTNLEAQYAETKRALQQLQVNIKQLNAEKKKLREELSRLLQKAREKCKMESNAAQLPSRLQTAFEALPNTVDEIESQLEDHQNELDYCGDFNRDRVREYEESKQMVERLDGEIEEAQTAFDNFQEHVHLLREEWLGPLRELIEKINENFARFFRALNCAGEVELDAGSDPEDYSNYGIKLKVKFRDTESLKELTSMRQSGGERSVSTILFMLALQELSQVPFRVVDEINQGMDAINERKVFELMVGLLSGELNIKVTPTQYFMLTPKLLPDLEYNPKMTMLIICNGIHSVSSEKWNVKNFLNIKRNMNNSRQ